MNAAGTAPMWRLNASGTTLSGSPQYKTIGLAPGLTFHAFGAGIFGLAIEGTILDYLRAYYLTHYVVGRPASGAVIFRHVFSRAVAGVVATGPSTFALLKNGTGIFLA
jgi:hypothetical protein